MTTLEDKILGEKTHYYCSSSEDEGNDNERDDNEVSDDEDGKHECVSNENNYIPDHKVEAWEGTSVNTGPKGVIKDWQRYKQLENERREGQEREKIELMKKLSLACQSELEERQAEKKDGELDEEIERLLSSENDPYLDEYIHHRMEEMMRRMDANKQECPTFGRVIDLETGADFLEAVDHENPSVTVVSHIYSADISGCQAMNACLLLLAPKYRQVKFCTIEASSAGMSKHFEKSGVPALLVYKGGNLLGNFVRLTDEFGDDFFAGDVENFLIEHGLLPDHSLVPHLMRTNGCIRNSAITYDDGEDSE